MVQIVTADYSTLTTSSSNVYADTGLSGTITPTSASNKIIIFTNQNCQKTSANGGTGVNMRLLRGATALKTYNGQFYTNTQMNFTGAINLIYVDSPNTTSATTYKTQFSTDNALPQIVAQYNNERSEIILVEVTP